MRRRAEEPGAVPPAEVVDYRAWCQGRGVAPYGDPGDLGSMRAAVARWAAWMEQREAWVAASGCREVELDMVGDAPWDPDAI